MDPVTGPPPIAELSMGLTAPLVSGANAPLMNFGPAR